MFTVVIKRQEVLPVKDQLCYDPARMIPVANSNNERFAFLKERIFAAALDLGLPLGLWVILALLDFPVVGMLLNTTLILGRDGFAGQSLGKRWKNLIAVNVYSDQPISFGHSALRNLFIAVPVLGLVMALVEGVLMIRDPDYRRLGDQFAGTTVVSNLEDSDGV